MVEIETIVTCCMNDNTCDNRSLESYEDFGAYKLIFYIETILYINYKAENMRFKSKNSRWHRRLIAGFMRIVLLYN